MSYILNKIKNHKLIVFFIVVGTLLRSTFALGMAGYSKYVFDGIGQKSIAVGSTLVIGLLVTLWGGGWSADQGYRDRQPGQQGVLRDALRLCGLRDRLLRIEIERTGRRARADKLYAGYRGGCRAGSVGAGSDHHSFRDGDSAWLPVLS